MTTGTTRETGDMLARPNWEWIKVDVLMPDHPKVEDLSDRAFRAIITLWCYAGLHRTDGLVSAKRWRELPVKVRDELVDHGLVEPLSIGGGALLHDFTGPDGHQRSRAEIDEMADRHADRQEIARKAARARWDRRDNGKPP